MKTPPGEHSPGEKLTTKETKVNKRILRSEDRSLETPYSEVTKPEFSDNDSSPEVGEISVAPGKVLQLAFGY